MGAAQQPLPGERIATFEQSLQENLQRLQQHEEIEALMVMPNSQWTPTSTRRLTSPSWWADYTGAAG